MIVKRNPRRHREGGLTLIEILLSLIVLTLGILGIIAVFPVALQTSKESVEDTQAALLADSVAQAMVTAMEFAKLNAGPPPTWEISLTHDLMWPSPPAASTSVVHYNFTLPDIADGWRHHPSTQPKGDPSTDDPKTMEYFKVAGDGWVAASVDTVREENDMSETFRQWGFSFDVAKIKENLEYLVGQPNPDKPGTSYTQADLEPLVRVFEFQIHIFRESTQGGLFGGGTGVESAGTTAAQHIQTFTKRISLK